MKGPGKFLSLARKFPDEKFVMICQQATGDDNYDELVAEAGKIDNLEFHKKVAFSEIDSYFDYAMVLVNTSDSEGFANTFIQAFKACAAVLSLNVNPDNILDGHDCGRCAGGSQEQLAEHLRDLLGRRQL